MSRIQLRGNCQLCGRLQAVDVTVAKHGYEVKDGYFQGVCHGHRFLPMQTQRSETDNVIKQVKAQLLTLAEYVGALFTGSVFPTHAKTGRKVREPVKGRWMVDEMGPYDACPSYYQAQAVEAAIYNAESRIRAGEAFCEQMQKLVDAVHGTPLVEVTILDAPAPIERGEMRTSTGGSVLTVTRVDGQRVYWLSPSGRTGWTGINSWRKFTPYV